MSVGLDNVKRLDRVDAAKPDQGGESGSCVLREKRSIDTEGAAVPPLEMGELGRSEQMNKLDIADNGGRHDQPATLFQPEQVARTNYAEWRSARTRQSTFDRLIPPQNVLQVDFSKDDQMMLQGTMHGTELTALRRPFAHWETVRERRRILNSTEASRALSP